MQTVSGQSLHPIGIGTWMMGGDFDEISRISTPNYDCDAAEIDAIRHAIELGQNHIDTAEMYGDGHTDELVGLAITDLARDSIFIADKLWKHSFGDKLTRKAVEKMLESLGTDYIDLLYIHSTFGDLKWEQAIEPINELIDQGVVRYFGVSNFDVDDMVRANELSTSPIVANQVHFNCLYKDEVTENFKQYCSEHGIDIVAYRPVECGQVFSNSVVKKIAVKYNVSEAQVAIAWLLARNALPIPKASKIDHVDDNFAAQELVLDDEDLHELDAL